MARSTCADTRKIVFVSSLLFLMVVLAMSHAPRAQAQDGPRLKVIQVNTVNYPAIKVTFEALGADELPIPGLGRDNFTVYENGRELGVVSTYAQQASPTPLTVMLVFDTSLSMADSGKLQQAQQATTAFVAQMRPNDRGAIIRFDSTLSQITRFTSDRGELMRQIEGLTAQGNTRLYDALNLALEKTATVDGNTAIVLVTDGRDTESAAGLSQLQTLIGDTRIPVYTIGIGSDIDERVLAEIATTSGGRYYAAPTPRDIGYTFSLMSVQLRNRYTLIYSSPATAAQGSTVDLELTARMQDGSARARTSYIVPAFTRPSNSSDAVSGIPQTVQAPAGVDLRTAYIGSALAMLSVLLATTGLVIARSQRAKQARLAFFVPHSGGLVVAAGGGSVEAGGNASGEEGQSLAGAVVVALASTIAKLVTRMLPPDQVQRISRQLTLAGNPFGWRVSHFVAVKCLGAVAGALAGPLLMQPDELPRRLVLAAGFGLLGFRFPTFWLKRRIKARQNQILKTLPDALDLLTICVEAGLGLDGAILEVVNKWDNALSEEFATVLAEMKMGRSRREALRGLAERTDVQEIRTFTSAMVQADELGMSIARPLALQAQQLRMRRRQRAEKLAHEAGIKIVVIMGLFIMPALFLIILSPAVIQLKDVFNPQ